MDFRIHSPSDTARTAHLWRESRIKDELARALVRRGHKIVYEDADLEIWLWCWIARPVNPRQNNVLWIISHPDQFIQQVGAASRVFNKIYCSSNPFTHKLRDKFGLDPEWLVCPAPTRPSVVYRPDRTVAFVGNADARKRRSALLPIFERYDSIVVGEDWQTLAPAAFQGVYVPWNEMHYVWNRGLFVPYTHHADMAREGFVADSALDAMANSGTLLIGDDNPGWTPLNLDVPRWQSNDPASIFSHIDYFLEHESERDALSSELRAVAKRFTYDYAASRFETCV